MQPWVIITRDTGTFTILDDDPVPTVSIGDAGAVTEGQALTFPITLSNPSYLPVSVVRHEGSRNLGELRRQRHHGPLHGLADHPGVQHGGHVVRDPDEGRQHLRGAGDRGPASELGDECDHRHG